MNRVRAGILGMALSTLVLILTGNPLWLLTLAGSGLFTGWNYGKRVIPADGTV